MFIQRVHARVQATTHKNASFKVVAAAPQTPQVGNLDALRFPLWKSDSDVDCKDVQQSICNSFPLQLQPHLTPLQGSVVCAIMSRSLAKLQFEFL